MAHFWMKTDTGWVERSTSGVRVSSERSSTQRSRHRPLKRDTPPATHWRRTETDSSHSQNPGNVGCGKPAVTVRKIRLRRWPVFSLQPKNRARSRPETPARRQNSFAAVFHCASDSRLQLLAVFVRPMNVRPQYGHL
jgi:hypothetical protein